MNAARRVWRWLAPRLSPRAAAALLTIASAAGQGQALARRLLREADRRLAAGDLDGAVTVYDVLDRRRPGAVTPARHYRLGRAAERTSRFPEAADAYGRAVAGAPVRGGWHYRHGRALQRCRRWAEAAVAYELALANGDDHPDVQDRLALMRAKEPQWIFRTHEPGHATAIASIPDAASVGVVAPASVEEIAGWIPASADSDQPVVFRLNGSLVASTYATRPTTLPDGRDYLEFRRKLKALWSYAGEGDVLVVEHAGRPLPIVGSGRQFSFGRGPSRAGTLLAALDDGHVLDKYGALRLSVRVDHDWQAAVFGLYTDLRALLRFRLGIDLFPFYGTLLGAIREHDFIGHDNDFDTVYVSDESTPEAVRAQFSDVCALLIDEGYSLRVKRSHTWVRAPGTRHKLDIFFAWFDADDHLQTSYGHHGPPVHRSAELSRFRNHPLGNVEIPVPDNAEAVLSQLYGPGWRQPDPGFRHQATTRVVDRRYRLSPAETTALYWREYYRDHRIDEPSPFARFVAEQFPSAATVLEVGCGNGRDSVFLATQGHVVVGIDRNPQAVEWAAEAARHTTAADRVRVEALDVADRAALTDLLTRAPLPSDGTDALAVYVRFFLHAVPRKTETALIDTLVAELPQGFTLFAEFRTVEDEPLPKAHDLHYRRYLDEQAFATRLSQRWGFEVAHLEAGRGLSPYGDEDPHLARIVAHLPARS